MTTAKEFYNIDSTLGHRKLVYNVNYIHTAGKRSRAGQMGQTSAADQCWAS